MPRTRQLAFLFPQHASYSADALIPTLANAEALTWLTSPETWPNRRLALYGPEGSGKTHLLHAFAERQRATLLPVEAMRHMAAAPPERALAIDDADTIPNPEILLHLLNAAAEAGLPVLLAGRTPPTLWPTTLPDLASRLRAATAVALGQPDDDLLRALLARLLAERQLGVEQALQDYLLARLPRHGAALKEAACRLDRLSLAAGRGVTRAMAADVLAHLGAEDEPVEPETSPAPPTLL